MLNHFVFNRTISKSIYIYNETDKTSAISSITRQLDLKSKEKEYIKLHNLHMAVTVLTQESLLKICYFISFSPTES